MSEKLLKHPIDVSAVVVDGPSLIIEAATGIFYDAQVGGMMCLHPSVEGFVLACMIGLDNIPDDHDYLCCSTPNAPHPRHDEFAEILKRELIGWGGLVTVSFDETRIAEMTEGWWPVIVKGENPHMIPPLNHKAWLHNGNCD